VEAPRFVAVVPGEERVLEPAEVSGQVVDVVELVVVRAEGTFDASVALRVVGPVEVVREPQFAHCLCEVAEELRAAVGLDCLDREGEAGDDLVESAPSLLVRLGARSTTRLRVKQSIAPNWKTVLPPGSWTYLLSIWTRAPGSWTDRSCGRLKRLRCGFGDLRM
jgi:hypothetical protein